MRTQFDWEYYLLLACSLALLVLGAILVLFLGMQAHRARALLCYAAVYGSANVRRPIAVV